MPRAVRVYLRASLSTFRGEATARLFIGADVKPIIYFINLDMQNLVLECGTHSPWVSGYLEVGEKSTRVFALCGIELNRARQMLATVR